MKCCRQRSVSVDPEHPVFSRLKQDLRFGTDEHTWRYNVLRQSQEGFHGFAKDDAHEALGAAGKRRVLGRTAQSLLIATLLTAAGTRKVRVFLTNAEPDEDGRLRVPRITRTGDRATTFMPPGGIPKEVERNPEERKRAA